MRIGRTACLAILLIGVASCTTREEPAATYAAPTYRPSALSSGATTERSYLDPGPVLADSRRPAYLQDSVTSPPRQSDSFGNDLLPRI